MENIEDMSQVHGPQTGRIKANSTVNRAVRRAMNSRVTALVNVIMEKALAGDSSAMLAASHLLIEANREK